MKSSIVLDMKRSAVREATRRFRTANPRVFGSVLNSTDRDYSDLDLLVDALPGATLFDLGGLQDELESLLDIQVDLLTQRRRLWMATLSPASRTLKRHGATCAACGTAFWKWQFQEPERILPATS